MTVNENNIGYNKLNVKKAVEWCINKHVSTNHYYDKYLPYEFHLRMVNQVKEDWKHLLPDNLYQSLITSTYLPCPIIDITHDVVTVACWGHDLIEDTRTNYNEILHELGEFAANIVYALTNEKGKNREERGNKKYYDGIVAIEAAVFVKLCDRIANVQYSKMTKSSMFKKYVKENDKFLEYMGYNDNHIFKDMFDYLKELLT